MRFDIITIFPAMFEPILNESIIKRGREKKKVAIRVHDLRAYTKDRHRKVDDRPFGGGPGMVMTPQPFFDAIKKIKGDRKAKVLLMSPSGKRLTQKLARDLAKQKNLILLCGHYEGVDERVRQKCVDESISIGDYVLTGGEIPAMVLIDCLTRLVPGVLGKEASLEDESFEDGLLEYPHYTRPANFRGTKVPDVLLSGHHLAISKWRKEQARRVTRRNRPDLIK
ncbi:MAG TPA: tRNA (guanosine(37)-N1)-methyltransferase TrmD [Candidatus Omnitrophica bacterium]|nr:MAG: tRNA (guanosine(37)-N1)-methyltransferase TrmD [Omnitrophica WOR_2 bacterium GWA2_53_43]HBO97906.1 tRNA (guanosine(37)-N1)-methyltransferase TrmD [Candidatus Omnitrophota bacterium]HCI45395.1 tRNA (guanosine(37)-N1)-methyltransferase TrmD [Candidatus Omnitrophota bacterium]